MENWNIYRYGRIRVSEKEVMSLTRYVLIPQRQGKTQRITLPMEMLRKKEWLKADCYMMLDDGKEEVTLKQYLYSDTKEEAEPEAWSSSRDNLSEGKDDN